MKKKFYLCILFLVTSLLYSLPYTHYTSDYLRIRNDYNLNSQIITVLEPNMGVEIIANGKKETIDGITSNWVKVISANGYVGWCFAGYLKPIEKDVSEILAKEVEKVKAGAYSNNYSLSNLKNISSILEFQGSEGYYIQQQSRGFQNSGRAPEILQLVIDNEKVFVKEIDIVNGEILTLKGNEFVFNGKTFAHNKSNIKINDKNQIHIFYLENVPEKNWLGTYEYEKPYTKSDINSVQLVNQTSDVLKNYVGLYKFDSFKIIKNENYIFPSLNVQNSKIDITYNDTKKCLSVNYRYLTNITNSSPSNNILDFIEVSSTEPFFWSYGEGAGFKERKFWFYKGGIAVSYEESKPESYIKYVVFLKKVE
ncbi:MAG: SH3 domain-containing protein [Spirochaetaceae bacterium]|nr:SH3 domain-containing protein [Spirochaetaceae bacterium]